ncbi:ribosome recycling factor [uncultured Rothia sp.]|uniref:ribosome recycling factor n=1 Tax=uncultured Rothia sp. TaxID=316088 RepID=UPI0028DCE9FA|nr:ribosome recycling factor [uncultured Rothia sp.]
MGFDIKGAVEQGLDKAQEVINEKAGKEVVTDEHIAKVEEVVTNNASKLTEKFGK